MPARSAEPPISGREDLPLIAEASGSNPVRERSDAARNRQRILAAAAELFDERGVGAVTMDDVATRAGVGKGTLFRRFGDRSGLAAALLDERERELQARILTGLAPLGPGPEAPGEVDPVDRLTAFVEAYLDYLDASLEMVLLSQTSTPGARHRIGAHAFWTTHGRLQLQSAGAPDPELRADVLLAALSAEQVQYWRHVRGLSLVALKARLAQVAVDLAAPGRAAG